MTESEQRQAVIAEARSWIGTRFMCQARLKRIGNDLGGVDCATLLCEVYERTGIVSKVDLPHYKRDWQAHASGAIYETVVQQFAHEVPSEAVQSGDIVLFLLTGTTKVFSHAGIVFNWPNEILHARWGGGVETFDVTRESLFKFAKTRFFSLWG
jgi:cell wall-associated NlpC family hydrolase